MYVKESKCSFVKEKVEYLGHYISYKGVEIDPRKIEVILNWLVPNIVKDLRFFLDLTGYYRKCIRGYAVICKPLFELLKKGG